jgi:hypothetical protein
MYPTWKWSLGLARASSPTGPWRKSEENPILNGSAVCDPKREFTGKVCINTVQCGVLGRGVGGRGGGLVLSWFDTGLITGLILAGRNGSNVILCR